ncbi:hypothetical protein CNR22_15155 [Sphingobacteriaceae bacterium]|nr:hypothetical protein CNR22_15155 [Sphingobacteriaceae bacterium]
MYLYIRAVKFLKEHSLFLCILFVCAVLRFIPLFDYQFTYDELSGLERTQFSSFSEVIEKGVKIDAHPALVQLLIYYLTQIFGYTTWIIKLPFLLFGFAAIIYAYAFGLRNFSKQAGLFAALIFSFSLIFVFYAPIARMYVSGVFFSIALLYYFFEIFFSENLKKSNYFFLALFAYLSALNQHINALFATTVFLSALFFLTKENYKAFIITCICVVLAYLPALPVTLYQLGIGGIGVDAGGWLETPEFTIVFSFLKTLLGTGRLYLIFFFLIALAFMLQKKVSISKKQIFLLLLFVINFLVVYLYSAWRSPIFQYSVMLFSGTAFIFFVCSFLEFKTTFVFYGGFCLLAFGLIYKTYVKKDYLGECVKTVFDYQFERTCYYKSLYGEKNVYPVFFDADEIMKKIYFNKYKTNFECKVSADSMISNRSSVMFKQKTRSEKNEEAAEQTVSSMRLFSEFVNKIDVDYLILTSAMPQFQAVVLEKFPYLLENTQTQGINFKLYSRKPEDRSKVVADDAVYYFSSPLKAGNFTYSKLSGNTTKVFPLRVDSLNEFPFDAKAALASVTAKEGQVVLISAKLKMKSRYSPLEVCISATDSETNKQYVYSARAASDFVMNADSTIMIYSEQFNGVHYNQFKYKANLTAYIWNRGKENFTLQNFEIKVIDYWHRKWELWE